MTDINEFIESEKKNINESEILDVVVNNVLNTNEKIKPENELNDLLIVSQNPDQIVPIEPNTLPQQNQDKKPVVNEELVRQRQIVELMRNNAKNDNIKTPESVKANQEYVTKSNISELQKEIFGESDFESAQAAEAISVRKKDIVLSKQMNESNIKETNNLPIDLGEETFENKF